MVNNFIVNRNSNNYEAVIRKLTKANSKAPVITYRINQLSN